MPLLSELQEAVMIAEEEVELGEVEEGGGTSLQLFYGTGSNGRSVC